MDLLTLLATHFPAAVASCTADIVAVMMDRSALSVKVDATAKCFGLLAAEAAVGGHLAVDKFLPDVEKHYVASLLDHSPQWVRRCGHGSSSSGSAMSRRSCRGARAERRLSCCGSR